MRCVCGGEGGGGRGDLRQAFVTLTYLVLTLEFVSVKTAITPTQPDVFKWVKAMPGSGFPVV